jgi:DNA-binding NtrC family response regulator
VKDLNKQAKILVVDDDDGILKTLATILQKEGYIVETAQNGEEAIEKSNSDFFNLALIDMRLPDMEGTQLLTSMKDTTPKMVKIMITGFPSLQNTMDALNKGADGYIVKPFDVESVLQTIKNHLEKQREAREYSESKVVEFVEARVREAGAPVSRK